MGGLCVAGWVWGIAREVGGCGGRALLDLRWWYCDRSRRNTDPLTHTHTHNPPINKPNQNTGLAAFGARRKEKLEREIDALIDETVALGNSGEEEGKDAEGAVKAVRTVGAYLTNLIKNFAVRI